ncbi:MAG: L,D-transpeptidase family protein [Clostridia bacterium]|nr:L,D-transpeptidase family protein [Clostridia bacterium]
MRLCYRIFGIVILLSLLFSIPAIAEEPGFTFVPDVLHPGKAERISFAVANDTLVTLEVHDESGATVHTIRKDMSVSAGIVNLTFNGCDLTGNALPEGQYQLYLYSEGSMFIADLVIGRAAPQITHVTTSSQELRVGNSWQLTAECSMPGTLTAALKINNETVQMLYDGPAQEGDNLISWDGMINGQPASPASYGVYLTLTDDTGFAGNPRVISLSITLPPTPTPVPTPTPEPIIRPSLSETETIPGDYWTMEMGNYDWDAIWDVMVADMTVISGRDQRKTYKLRKDPDDSTAKENIVGEVVFESQGVRVLETLDNGWTYIETYNASYGPKNYSSLRGGRGYGNTDELIRGYVETKLLETVTPSKEYGLLIDKYSQQLYILTEEGLMTTLLISTGFPTDEQPWNETVTGEYYLCSKVGDFPAGNLTCGYGMRIAGGCILHEVPYILNEKYDIRDYSYTEKYLGEKASHGCVRVQRKKNDDGINMLWIWNNVPLKTKVLIWDDDSRPMPYPADDRAIYYNPDGGKYYHDESRCSSVKDRYLPFKGEITYADLDTAEYSRLTPCPYCDPPLRRAEIDKINRERGF